MKKHTSSRSGLLLMEIIIAILFFSVVSAVCLQLFIKSHNLGQNTEELDMAVRHAGSVAEILSQSEQPYEHLQEIYSDSDIDENGGSIYFGKDFQTCSEEIGVYHLDISASPLDDGLTGYHIAVYANDDPEEIYSLDINTYTPLAPDSTSH